MARFTPAPLGRKGPGRSRNCDPILVAAEFLAHHYISASLDSCGICTGHRKTISGVEKQLRRPTIEAVDSKITLDLPSQLRGAGYLVCDLRELWPMRVVPGRPKLAWFRTFVASRRGTRSRAQENNERGRPFRLPTMRKRISPVFQLERIFLLPDLISMCGFYSRATTVTPICSLVAQRNHGIDLGRTSGGEITSQSSYAHQNNRHDGKGEGIARANPIEQVRQAWERSCEYQRAGCTGCDAGQNHFSSRPINRRRTFPLSAPSAMRMPISCTRCVTEYEITP